MARTTDPAVLGELALFAGLERADLARLAALLRWRRVAAGVHLMLDEQPGEAAYFIADGTVRVYAVQPTGSAVTLAIVGPGDVVGELSLLDDLGRSASAVTLEPTGVYWMGRSSFLDCLRTVPGMALNLTRILARRLRLADARLRALVSLDVEGRVAYTLLGLAREYGAPGPDGSVHIPLRLTQSDLAELVGASRVRVNQIMGTLTRRHQVEVDRHSRITALTHHGVRRGRAGAALPVAGGRSSPALSSRSRI
jgi:CRP/FNR family cyclic AMP-dependent transcriptional regulator